MHQLVVTVGQSRIVTLPRRVAERLVVLGEAAGDVLDDLVNPGRRVNGVTIAGAVDDAELDREAIVLPNARAWSC